MKQGASRPCKSPPLLRCNEKTGFRTCDFFVSAHFAHVFYPFRGRDLRVWRSRSDKVPPCNRAATHLRGFHENQKTPPRLSRRAGVAGTFRALEDGHRPCAARRPETHLRTRGADRRHRAESADRTTQGAGRARPCRAPVVSRRTATRGLRADTEGGEPRAHADATERVRLASCGNAGGDEPDPFLRGGGRAVAAAKQ